MRRGLAVVLIAVAALSLTACRAGLSDTGEPLTTEQAELLAQTRFRVAAEGPQALEISIGADDAIDHLALDVTYDPTLHAAWGTMLRGPEELAVEEQVAFTQDTYAQLTSGQWVTTELGAGPSPALAVVFALSGDRPENSQLLRQSDARYLGTVDVDGVPQQVFRTPTTDGEGEATTRLWLDEVGSMQRLDAGDDETLVILLTDDEPQPQPDGLVFGDEETDGE